MNNNNIRQISDEEIKKSLTKEELQQTQVLNFDELEKTIRIEKKTSKRPAILIAIIGVISLAFGSTLQIANTLNQKSQNIQKREVKKDILIEKTKLDCTKTTLNNPDGTNTIYNITYNFENDKLVGFTKEYNISAILGNEEGKKSIEKYTKEYNNLLNEVEGYSINISSTENTTIYIKVVVDYKKLDLTKLNDIQQINEFTKVEYSKNTSYKDIREKSLNQGFTVE